MTSFPIYGCAFCPHTYASESRCGQHLDNFLRDYCAAYTRTPTTHRLETHPVAAIRAVRVYAKRRPGKKNRPVKWDKLTVAPADGEPWEFIVTLNNQDELDAFKKRPMRTAEQWLVHLNAVPVPESPSSSSSESLSESSSEESDTITLAAPTPSPAPSTPTPLPAAARARRTNVLARNMRDIVGVGAGPRGTGISVRAGNSVALEPVSFGSGSISVGGDQALHTPVQDDDDAGFAHNSPPPHESEPIHSPNTSLMSAFFTPGNARPGHFELRITGSPFAMWITRETALSEVVAAVQREVLHGAGWPVLKGLCYAGKEVDGDVWSGERWEDVKVEGRNRKMGVVVGALVF